MKDALLELLEEQPFEKITVAALCRQAEITRATFYLHFQDINEVLDELLDEADKLFMMMVYGLFYVNRSLKWSKDDGWYKMQMMLNRFLSGGLEALRKK